MVEAVDICLHGIVQGVGFRPFVYRLAKKYLINGWVLNATDGVHIHAEGESALLDEFVLELSESDSAPAAAQISEIDLHEVPLQDCKTFEIRFSDEEQPEQTTLVSPEIATCSECLRELFNTNDRRFRYPFINCTNCGPRFTIIDELPYDRKNTSMRAFTMCDRCAAEYSDPTNRRFHAQPNACFECGPHISWRKAPCDENKITWGNTREESDAIFASAIDFLLAGKIIAVKGLGGFHLVCDAHNASAVAKLRTRKQREGKAFAVMMANVGDVRSVCEVSDIEAAVLEGSKRPIVLLRKRSDAPDIPHVADNLSELGVMLPYTPVQHILMHDFALALQECASDAGDTDDAHNAREVCHTLNVPMLVMTSGNIHDEPIVIDDEDAYVKLGNVADAFLGNDRAILTRFDDSVVRIIQAGGAEYAVQFIRRARGYAPLPLDVSFLVDDAQQGDEQRDDAQSDDAQRDDAQRDDAPDSATFSDDASAKALHLGTTMPALFATGPEQKNTFTLLRGAEAFVSQHIGDMDNAETFDAWLETKQHFENLFKASPQSIACDMHPEYLTSKWAHEQALPVTEVQHHHAHIAAVLAEHGLEDAVCGVAFDGTGYGVDGAIWGGEVLLANLRAFERFANFAYAPMPGGAAAIRHPLRMAYGVLWAYDLLEHPGAQRALELLGDEADVCETMIDQGINTPMTSSVGRLFDAASALLGICTEPCYEGESAVLLEACMSVATLDACSDSDSLSAKERYAVAITKNVANATSTARDTSVLLLDARPTFQALLDDFMQEVPAPVISRRFHDAFVDVIVQAAELARGLYGIETVALSGGVFMNRYLIEHSLADLEAHGFTVAVNRDLPPNDGCISFGQAVVAWAQANEE